MTTILAYPGDRCYLRTMGGPGPAVRTFATLTRVRVTHDLCDVSSLTTPAEAVRGLSRVEYELTGSGRFNSPVDDREIPLVERLALAVLDGDDTAVYPLIDEFLMSRGK